ncbi:hypothetical protein HQ544_05260 [Candidatus Falkowbacteria bacterium]|nr:hypothetical protein [Candidatus Falkowbacteria bacterium]
MKKKKKKSLYSKLKTLLFIFRALKGLFFVYYFFKKIAFHIKSFKKDPPMLKAQLKNIFIPHKDNNHTPRALRPPALGTYAVIIILTKVLISSYLFLTFPTVLSAFTTIETEVQNLINESRTEIKATPLTTDPELSRAAQAKADDMVLNNYFSHYGPDGKKPWDWIDYSKYSYSLAGENLAKDFITAGGVHHALMESSTHKKNILNSRYRHLGIGIATGRINGNDTLVLVQMFGALKSTASVGITSDIKDNIAEIEKDLFGEGSPSILAQANSSENPENLAQVKAQNLEVATAKSTNRDWVQTVMYYSDILMFVFLGFLVVALLLNIFVHIRIQKPQTITTTIVIIGLVLVIMFTNFHYLEGLARVISIK